MNMKHLKDKHGEMYVRTCICIMILSMVFVIILNFSMSVAVARSQRKSTLHILESYTQANAVWIYNQIKQHSDQTESVIAAEDFMAVLSQTQQLTSLDGVYSAPVRSDGQSNYKMKDVELGFILENTTKIYLSYTLQIPLKFLGQIVWMDVPVTLRTSLDAKFDESEKPSEPENYERGYSFLSDGRIVGSSAVVARSLYIFADETELTYTDQSELITWVIDPDFVCVDCSGLPAVRPLGEHLEASCRCSRNSRKIL